MSNQDSQRKDVGGGGVALLLVAIGALVLYDTRSYGDPDSAVFPQTVAIVLMVIAAITAFKAFIGSKRETETWQASRGSWPRRILLPAIMLACVAPMKYLGFLPAMLIMFVGLLLVANHDGWTIRRTVAYGLSAVGVVTLFYAVFRYWLLVPLP